MMNKTIKEIENAEKNASQLIINAKAEAKYRFEKANENWQKIQHEEEARLEDELANKLNSASKDAEKIILENEIIAQRDAADLEKKAKGNMQGAIKFILEVIKESWQ